jgi:tRNA(Ile)-lysidine synthase
VHSLAERVLRHIRRHEFLKAGDRVGVAASGGIDSVALLRLMLELRGELGLVVSVVHFNHKLRGAESDGDEQFVAGLAREHGLEFYCDINDVASHARDRGVSLETAARELRYGFFNKLLTQSGPQGLKPSFLREPDGSAEAVPFHESPSLRSGEEVVVRDPSSLRSVSGGADSVVGVCLDKIATGHTLDDQAETILMRLIRGAGLRGLGGIHPRIAVEDDDGEMLGEIVRPLLEVRRRELKAYLTEVKQPWREDASNLDTKFTRNRVRKLLVPLLEKEFNPSVAENLSELAEIARGEEDYWENEIAGWMGTAVHWAEPEWAKDESADDALVQISFSPGAPSKPSKTQRVKDSDLESKIDNAPWLVANATLDHFWFLSQPLAVQRRAVKAIGEHAGIPLEFQHIDETLRLAEADGPDSKEVSLPHGWKVLRQAGHLIFVTPDLREPAPTRDYEYDLSVPGRISVPELGVTIEVRRVPADATPGYNPQDLLDADSLPGPLRVRNWRPGERFWPAHTKSPKKIKELLQERHLAQPDRRLWPVIVSGGEIVWMRDFATPARFQAKPASLAIMIEVQPYQ